MALSPWPASTATVTLKTAAADLRAALGEPANKSDPFAFDDVDAQIQRTAAAVSARIEAYAPGAPQAAKDEAMVRAVAWLRDTHGAKRVSKISVVDLEPAPVHSGGWFRQSGAMSLLSAWRIRGAFAVEETSA